MDMDQTIYKLNVLRKKTENKLILFYCVVGVIGFLVLVSSTKELVKFGEAGGYLIIGIIVICLLIIGVGQKKIIRNYRSTFKNTMVPIALQQFGDDITYSEEGISQGVAETTHMFGHFTHYKSEDTVSGKVSDVNFNCADVKLGYYVSSGKSRRYVPVCHGQLYIFDFNKRFITNTIIKEKRGDKPLGYTRIKLENEEFNQQFFIYSNNQHDAFYILTPHFMEKLLELERKHRGTLFIAFYNSQLHIGVHNDKDRFEPPLFQEIKKNIIQSQLEDLNIINDIIEELKLNVRIFI